MPELPEVETIAQQLNSKVCGRKIRQIRLRDPKLSGRGLALCTSAKVVRVERVGKQVVFVLKLPPPFKGELYLSIHLRMTGRLIWQDGEPSRADRVELTERFGKVRAELLLDNGCVFFFDLRRFGTIRIEPSYEALLPSGIDPLTAAFTPKRLFELLKDGRQNLKTWLLRQDKLVGIGNIYASEILHKAALNPFRLAGSVTAKEVRRLHHAVQSVLTRAIEYGGTSFSDFMDSEGKNGNYQGYLRVYQRSGERCGRCGGTIEREKQNGRSTFYCPQCQLLHR